MELILIRHGQTEYNKYRAYQGWMDCCLDNTGLTEAKHMGTLLEGEEVDAIFSSPLKRARDTADIIAKNVGSPPLYLEDRIKEINFGLFEGLTYEEIQRRYKEETIRWERETENYCFPKGESIHDFYGRISDFMKDLEKMDYKKTVLVTHGGCIKCMLSFVACGSMELFWKFTVNTGSISRVMLRRDFSYIISVNENNLKV